LNVCVDRVTLVDLALMAFLVLWPSMERVEMLETKDHKDPLDLL